MTLEEYAAEVSARAAETLSWQGLFDVEWRRRARHQGKNDLVRDWHRLGFVVPKTKFGETVFVESDRGKYELLGFREYFYYLMNMEHNDGFLPKARALADEYLRLARELEPELRADPNFDQYAYFAYDPITFGARLEKVYENERRAGEAYNPATGAGEPLFRTAARVVERIRQLALLINWMAPGWNGPPRRGRLPRCNRLCSKFGPMKLATAIQCKAMPMSIPI